MASSPAIIMDDADPIPAADPAPVPATPAVAAVPAPAAPEPTPATPAADPKPADDWRVRASGGDEKLLGYLARVPSEKALVETLKRYNDDMKAGKFLKPLSDNPTDEEIAAHRKATGVPEAADGYLQSLPDGLVVGDDDKPFVEKFLTNMHASNAPPAMVNAALETYYSIVEEQVAAQAEAEHAAQQAGVEDLRTEWGPDYRRNLNAMHAHLDTLPEAVANAFRFGKGADGLPLGYNPAVLKWLAAQALEANPLSTVVPGAGANQAGAIADEIAKIETAMRTDRSAYNRDEKMQARYRELIGARLKLEGNA